MRCRDGQTFVIVKANFAVLILGAVESGAEIRGFRTTGCYPSLELLKEAGYGVKTDARVQARAACM